MDSTCLQQFSTDLQIGDSILDDIIEYSANSNSLIDNVEDTIGLPSIDELMFKSKAIVETKRQEIPIMSGNNLNSFINNPTNYNNKSQFITKSKLEDICHRIVQEMNYLGLCVINNFMEEFGNNILLEVMNLYNTVFLILYQFCLYSTHKVRGRSFIELSKIKRNLNFYHYFKKLLTFNHIKQVILY